MEAPEKRVGLYGGTFDPIHYGHIRPALEALESFHLDTMIFIPSHAPPHKKRGGVAHWKDRLEMVKLAVSEYPKFKVSDLEIKRSGYSFSIDTLETFTKTLPGDKKYFFLGIDAFLEIHTWKRYEELPLFADFVILARPWDKGPGYKELVEYSKTNGLDLEFSKFEKEWVGEPSGKTLIEPKKDKKTGYTAYYLPCTKWDISSTMVRKLVAQGKSIKGLVPEQVELYIKKTRIYDPK